MPAAGARREGTWGRRERPWNTAGLGQTPGGRDPHPQDLPLQHRGESLLGRREQGHVPCEADPVHFPE